MTNAKRWMGTAVGCLVLLAACCAGAQDWPQWRGAQRDGKVTDFQAPADFAQARLTQKWKVTVGSGDSTPALVGERLYAFTRQGDQETVLCLNAADGQELWKNQYAARAVTGAAARHPGPRSSPAVAEGKVVTLGASGILSCLDAANGQLVWRNDEFREVPQFFTAMSPIIADGLCIAQLGGRGQGGILGFDLATGQKRWQWTEEDPEYASPVLLTADGTNQIVTLTGKSIVGVGAADGKLLWRLPFAPQSRAYNAATPIVDGQTVIYTGAGRGTRAVKIEKQGQDFAARELWHNPELAPQYNTPILQDGLLFGMSNRGQLFCINAENGQTAWVEESSLDRSGFGSIISAGSVLLALPSGGELIAFSPSGERYQELARFRLTDSSAYAHPVVAGNRIYVKDQDAVILWTLE